MNTNPFNAGNDPTCLAAETALNELQRKMDTVETWVKTSRLVLQCQAIRHEIEVHKWCESEKVGHDIGWEHATASWHLHYGHLPVRVPAA